MFKSCIFTICIFICIFILLILFNVSISKKIVFNDISIIDPIMDIYVPPAENSHPRFKNWCSNDNNIPGILPGPRPGNTLGLNNTVLSLLTPIKAPLIDNIFPNKCCPDDKSMNRLPIRLYYKNIQKCNPYNGSYCQCTNNFQINKDCQK